MAKDSTYPFDTSHEGFLRSDREVVIHRDRVKESRNDVTQFAFNVIKGKRQRRPPRKRIAMPGDVIGGRPQLVADIPAIDDERGNGGRFIFEDVIARYKKIIRKLTYKEAMALCRAFGYKYSTYQARCSGYRPAQLWEALLVVDWYNRGKPIVRRKNVCWKSLHEVKAEIDAALAEIKEREEARKARFTSIY